jgi:hypothetical protein
VKTVNLNGHDILKCQEKHKPMSSAASLPLCYRRAAAKILREIILLTELAHDNIVKVRRCIFILPRAESPVAYSPRRGAPSGSGRRRPPDMEAGE